MGKRIVLAMVAAVMVFTACSAEDKGSGDGEAAGSLATSEELAEQQTGDEGAGGGSTAVLPSAQLPSIGPAVIKTASLAIEVEPDSTQDAIDDAVTIAQESGGFILSTSLENESSGTGKIVLRIPAENFESTLASLDDLGRVANRSVRGEDVTEEFVDLEARLRNFEAQEGALLRLMDRAQSVADTIRVQRELTPVQLEIERIRGRLRFLEDQTALGTITVTLTEKGVTIAEGSMIAKAWSRAREMFLSVVSGVIIGLGVVVPVGLLALVAIALGMKVVKPRITGRA